MIGEPFANGSSFLHKRDPRIKLIGAAGISLVMALSSSLIPAATGFFLQLCYFLSPGQIRHEYSNEF